MKMGRIPFGHPNAVLQLCCGGASQGDRQFGHSIYECALMGRFGWRGRLKRRFIRVLQVDAECGIIFSRVMQWPFVAAWRMRMETAARPKMVGGAVFIPPAIRI